MTPPRSLLIACDKFKGSLTAAEACAAIARGLQTQFPRALIDSRPIADGGEGFAASLQESLDGRWVEVSVSDALGRPVTARYVLANTPSGPLAVMEMAEASGLWRIAPDERDITRSSTRGTGEMMRHAIIEHGVQRIVIGIGGSATNDGGAGMAAALGARFLDANNHLLEPTPRGLWQKLVHINTESMIKLPAITVACDVDSLLLGPAGASRVFGPQKGADETTMPLLEEVLEAIANASGAADLACQAGAGAAGGLGFGLLAFAHASLVPGFDLLASLTGLEDAIVAADWIITGEGSLDAQSLAGKGPIGIAKLARNHGKPVIAFCGKVDAAVRASGQFDRISALADCGLPIEILIARAAELLEAAATVPLDAKALDLAGPTR